MSRAKKILRSLALNEMATIGRIESKKEGKFRVTIHHEPLGNPSLHLMSFRSEYEVVLQLKDLKIFEWKFNEKSLKKIPKTHLKELVKFLKEKDPKAKNQTHWKTLIQSWNRENPNHEVNLEKETPDYKI